MVTPVSGSVAFKDCGDRVADEIVGGCGRGEVWRMAHTGTLPSGSRCSAANERAYFQARLPAPQAPQEIPPPTGREDCAAVDAPV